MIRHICCALAALVLSTSTLACTADAQDSEVAETNDEGLVSRSATFDIREGADGQFYFSLVAANGEKLVHSEGYVSWANAVRGSDALLDAAISRAAYAVNEAKDGQYYFDVVAPNGEIVGTSELYVSKAHAQRGAETVRTTAVKMKGLDATTK